MVVQPRPEKRIPTHAVGSVLSSYASLSAAELDVFRTKLTDFQLHPVGAPIGGETSGGSRIVLSGWVAWTAQLPDGRRQILSLGLPGDLLESAAISGFGASHVALSPTQTADAAGLIAALEVPGPELGALAAAWRGCALAARERTLHHIVRLGRLSAPERIASLFIELHDRQRRAGLADDASMPLPLTQEMISDILGLSVVHVNRVLQQLKREALIAYRAGRVVFPDLNRLARAAGRG